ncbi:hypothetical protein, partial [Vibrio sp. 10N.261.49.C12]|uniref:hypothetical protein n=1 Tax=Vibrio sp. 10N.261.49.C12 TaxID=3229671 RepID=UPI003552890D
MRDASQVEEVKRFRIGELLDRGYFKINHDETIYVGKYKEDEGQVAMIKFNSFKEMLLHEPDCVDSWDMDKDRPK